MSEFAPPGVAENAAEPTQQALTPDAVSAVLDDFRAWLTALPAANGGDTRSEEEFIDLHTLLAQFIAVRQEVNLQTRAVRAQQEQNVETLRQLTAALETLRQSQARGGESQEHAISEAVRPLLKTLVDLYDALSLAGREMRRLSETVLPSLEQLAAPAEDEPPPAPAVPSSFWGRMFRSPLPRPPEPSPAQRERERLARDSAERVRQLLASLLTGYTMSLQRVERALRQHGLEAMETTGQRFDPEQMEVVEAVADSGRPSGEVVEEVRRGYLWNGRVFRYAQVRVAKKIPSAEC
jgi:molecular chaperone GrpE